MYEKGMVASSATKAKADSLLAIEGVLDREVVLELFDSRFPNFTHFKLSQLDKSWRV